MTFPFVFLAELFLDFVYLVSVSNFECLCAQVLCKRLFVRAWIERFFYVHATFSLYTWIPVYENKIYLYAWLLTTYISNLYAWSVAILSTFLSKKIVL